jgi:hypothetical protein
MSQNYLNQVTTEWRTKLERGTMDRQKAVFQQLIESATFDGEELTLVPNMATLTGTEVKVASPRGLIQIA